jgi:hypothetical protein
MFRIYPGIEGSRGEGAQKESTYVILPCMMRKLTVSWTGWMIACTSAWRVFESFENYFCRPGRGSAHVSASLIRKSKSEGREEGVLTREVTMMCVWWTDPY